MASTTHSAPRRSTNPGAVRRLTPAHEIATHRAETARERGGLPDGESPYALIRNLKYLAGYTPEWTRPLVDTLERLMEPIPRADWPRGRPVNWETVSNLSHDLGISPRGFRYRVNRLMELGALAFHDSGNCRRYRTPTDAHGEGETFGIDLAPCILLAEEAKARAAQIRAERNAHTRLRHRASALRSRIRACLRDPAHRDVLADQAPALDADLDAIHTGRFDRLARALLEILIERFTNLLARCRALLGAAIGRREQPVENTGGSLRQDTDFFRHGGTGLPSLATLQPDPVPPNCCSPPGHAPNRDPTVAQLVEALPESLVRTLPPDKRIAGTVDIDDLYRACAAYRPRLGISPGAWNEAQRLVGVPQAIIVLIITAARSAATWPEERRVYNPGGFFRALSRCVKAGNADLRASIHGIVAFHLGPRAQYNAGEPEPGSGFSMKRA